MARLMDDLSDIAVAIAAALVVLLIFDVMRSVSDASDDLGGAVNSVGGALSKLNPANWFSSSGSSQPFWNPDFDVWNTDTWFGGKPNYNLPVPVRSSSDSGDDGMGSTGGGFGGGGGDAF